MTSDLKDPLRRLKLQKIAQVYQAEADVARDKRLTFEGYLEVLVHQEIVSKQERALRQRLGQAKFPLVKTLDAFDFALALAYAACQKGTKTFFVTAADLINGLYASLADHSLERQLKTFTAPKLLVIDEVGFLPFDQKGADLFFQVISKRYEKGSIILTTNRPFKDWGEIFHNNTLAGALIDRLVHHAEIITLKGESYRVREKKKSV